MTKPSVRCAKWPASPPAPWKSLPPLRFTTLLLYTYAKSGQALCLTLCHLSAILMALTANLCKAILL